MVPVSSSRPAILGATILLGAVFAFSAWCAVAAIDPTPRKALQCERHEGVFTMTLAHGTDRLESARLVLRRITPDDLPFFESAAPEHGIRRGWFGREQAPAGGALTF